MQTHHTILFEGSGETARQTVFSYLEEHFGVTPKGNPDYSVVVTPRLTVDDARTIKDQASHAPVGPLLVFLLCMESATREAQNALLKVLEEPAYDVLFVLVVPNPQVLLPTVRSRCLYEGKVSSATGMDAQAFLQAPPAERIALIAPIISDEDRSRARAFCDTLEATLHASGLREHTAALKELAAVRTYLNDTSCSRKMILEHLAAVLPRM